MTYYYAQITSGICTGVSQLGAAINAPNMVPIASMDDSLLGASYADGVFTPPAAPAPIRHVTQLAFISRFTDAEAIALDLASIGATEGAASLRRYLNKVNVARFIDLDRADTRAGVQALETAGLLAAGRALVILDAEIAAGERP